MIRQLETGLKHFAKLLKKETNTEVEHLPGAGAAGGIAVGAVAFLNADIIEGTEFILKKVDFLKWAQWADVIITGEGRLDEQSLNNKAPFVVAKYGKELNKPVYAICGINKLKNIEVFEGIFQIADEKYDLDYSIRNAGKLIYSKTIHLAELLLKK